MNCAEHDDSIDVFDVMLSVCVNVKEPWPNFSPPFRLDLAGDSSLPTVTILFSGINDSGAASWLPGKLLPELTRRFLALGELNPGLIVLFAVLTTAFGVLLVLCPDVFMPAVSGTGRGWPAVAWPVPVCPPVVHLFRISMAEDVLEWLRSDLWKVNRSDGRLDDNILLSDSVLLQDSGDVVWSSLLTVETWPVLHRQSLSEDCLSSTPIPILAELGCADSMPTDSMGLTRVEAGEALYDDEPTSSYSNVTIFAGFFFRRRAFFSATIPVESLYLKPAKLLPSLFHLKIIYLVIIYSSTSPTIIFPNFYTVLTELKWCYS